MESFEYTGHWWLPEKPDRKLRGNLKFDPSSTARLTLNGQLFPMVDFSVNDLKEIPIIHGIIDGVAYTLQQCIALANYKNFGIGHTDIQILYIFRGQHFAAVEDIVFDEVTVSYPSLDDWIDHGKSDISISYEARDDSLALGRAHKISSLEELVYHIASVPFDPITFHSQEGQGVRIEYTLTRRLPGNDESSLSLKNRARLSVLPSQALPFFGTAERPGFYSKILYRLSYFLTLATGQINDAQSVCGTITASGSSQRVQVYVPTRIPKHSYYMQPLFALVDVQNDLSKYLTNWHTLFDRLWEVFDLYFRWNDDLYAGRLYHTTTDFLNMARALEAYHRRLYDKPYIDEAKYRRKKKKIIRAIRGTFGKDFGEKLVQDLAYGNSYSFAQRLRSICVEVLCDVSGALGEVLGDLDGFVRTVVDTRNDLTHMLENPGENAIRRDDLKSYHEFVTKMRILLRMCFLTEMEFPPALVSRLITENRKHENLM